MDKKIESIITEKPKWYYYRDSKFNMYLFNYFMNHTYSSISYQMTSPQVVVLEVDFRENLVMAALDNF